MYDPTVATTQPRRTQAERREATRTALLEATITSLVEDGYAGTTTRRVAERAGVTPGALQHHFPSKADLVAEALKDLADRLIAQILEPTVEASVGVRERAEALIDRAWEVHRGPLFVAALELWVAARTDPEPRASMDKITDAFGQRIAEAALYAFPEAVARPGFVETMMTGLAAMRGLALQGFTSTLDPELFWPATRAHLLSLFELVVPELAEGPPKR
jgi:AcrR family transcriptional regulator